MYNTTKPYNKKIIELIRTTWETPYVSVLDNGTIERKFLYSECRPHTDGIGTKGFYHWKCASLKEAVIDALAMNLNDLVMRRAIPYGLNNHLILPIDDGHSIIRIIEEMTAECRKRDIAILDGETSIQNNIDGLEISVTMLGFVPNIKPNKFQKGDILIGLESNGLHANGFTRIKEIFGGIYCNEFTKPTNIYSDLIMKLEREFQIDGLVNITGGAFTKLRNFSGDLDFNITDTHDLEPHKIFYELNERGVDDEEMYKTFNCGIGFILGIKDKDVMRCLSNIDGFKADIIGDVQEGSGKINIKSKFSNKTVNL